MCRLIEIHPTADGRAIRLWRSRVHVAVTSAVPTSERPSRAPIFTSRGETEKERERNRGDKGRKRKAAAKRRRRRRPVPFELSCTVQ